MRGLCKLIAQIQVVDMLHLMKISGVLTMLLLLYEPKNKQYR
jgi:hypothetical protein